MIVPAENKELIMEIGREMRRARGTQARVAINPAQIADDKARRLAEVLNLANSKPDDDSAPSNNWRA
jgi:hypothetical protein